jgi:hypothetical protein
MSALLEKLGVPRNVRLFFTPFFEVLPDGSLSFPFGNAMERFGASFHIVPAASDPWIAGDGPLLFYSHSAMEAIAFLSLNGRRFPDLSLLRFVAVGNHTPQLPRFPYRKCALLFEGDLLGRIWDIHAATQLSGRPVSIFYVKRQFDFILPGRAFGLPEDSLSLSAFERAAGLRSGIRTYKSTKSYQTFLELLTQRL